MIRALTLGTAGLIMLAAAGPAATSAGPTATRALRAQVQAHAESSDEPRPEVVNDEVVLAELDATGLPERAILVSRVTVAGAEREVIDPASTTNVRYLDRLGRPSSTPDGVLLVVGGDRPMALTEARFDKPLPVALHAEYAVDGDVVAAADVPGATGEVTVTYTLTNTTAEQAELTYPDASGQEQAAVEPVFVPFQGSLTATLPEDAELVGAPDAMLATDEQGRTVARWNVSLFPPISTPIQTLELTMRTERAAVPGAEVLLTPAGTDQDPATGFADELLDGSNSGSGELYEGLSTLDAAAGDIAQGTDELATGLAALAEGASAASGASETLAQGVGGLADGAVAAADASDTLAQGVGGLATGAVAAADASDTLAQGLGGLATGADDVAAGSAELAGALGQAAAGAQDLARATAALARATSGNPEDQLEPLIVGGAQIEAGMLEAAARIGSPSDPVLDLIAPLPPDDDTTCSPGGTAPPDDDCVTIYQGVRALRDGLAAVDAVAAALEGRVDAAREAIVATLEGLGSISDDVSAAAKGAAELYASVCRAPDPRLDADSCAQLLAVAGAAESALATAGETVPDIKDLVAALAILEKQAAALSAALDVALASTERLLLGVEAVGLAVGTGTPDQPGLATAMSALNAGLGELAAELARSQQELTTAVSAVAAGSADLATGIDGAATGADDLSGGSELLAQGAKDAASGAGALADGSDQLAEGAKDAASGAGALAEGSDQLAQGAQDAVRGAGQLSSGLSGLATGTDGAAVAGGYLAEGAQALQDGTGPAAEAVLDASISPALARAWLEATAERAAEALPYGAPVGAQGNVAYVFSLAEVPAPRSFWERIRGMFGG